MLFLISNTGYRCDRCDDGYYDRIAAAAASNDAAVADGGEKDKENVRECARCRCNNNIDSNAVGNCDRSAAHYMFALLIAFLNVFTIGVLESLSLDVQQCIFVSCFRGNKNTM